MIILSSGIACDWLASLDIASNVSFNESVASVRCCSNANAHTRILMRRNDIVHTIMRAYNSCGIRAEFTRLSHTSA